MAYSTTVRTKKITPAEYLKMAAEEPEISVKIGYLRAARAAYVKSGDKKLTEHASRWIFDAASKEEDPEKKIGYLRGERGFYLNSDQKENARRVQIELQEIQQREKIKDAGWYVKKAAGEIEKGNPTAVGYLQKAGAAYKSGGKPEMQKEILRQLPDVRAEIKK